MSANSRLTVAVHALAWIGRYTSRGREVATSDQIAGSVGTNPVVIRRMLGELRAAGLVEARRGPGSGWFLRRELSEITVLDVHDALGGKPAFGLHAGTPDPGCVIGGGIQPVLTAVYARADEAMRAELRGTTVADVLAGILAAR